MKSSARSGGSAALVLLATALVAACGGDSTGPASPPNAPSSLTGVANTTTQITLNWVLPAGTVSEVKIQRAVGGGALAPLTTLKPAANTYVDSGLTPSTAYRYQVQACNGASCSTASEVSVTTPAFAGQTPLAVWNPALPPSLVNYPYTPLLRTTGGTGAAPRWSLVSGSLPPGVRFNDDGSFSGTPSATGSFPITVRVTAGSENAQRSFTIQIIASDPGRWSITRMDVQTVAPTIEPSVQAAIRRWEGIITGDLHVDTIPNGFYRPSDCGGFGRATEGAFIDDMFLIVNIGPLEGNVLGQATVCGYRYDDETSVIGVLTLNSTALGRYEPAIVENVVFHEIGHTLGFGIMWYSEKFNYIPSTACVSPEQIGEPEFTGPLAVKAWQDAGGTGNPPVENQGGPGTACAHWRDSVFKTELMTGFIKTEPQQVSAITIASMADLGFKVDMSKADPYRPPATAPGLRAPSPWTTDLWVGPGPWEIVQAEPLRRLGGSGPRDRR